MITRDRIGAVNVSYSQAKAEQRKKDAELPFDEKVEIVLALRDASRALRNARR